MLSLSKSIVVVDAHVNVHDYADVFFRVTANVDPKRDVLITEGPLDHLDHAPGRQFYGGKLGIDATHKLPEEDARPWPEEIVMSDEIRDARDAAAGPSTGSTACSDTRPPQSAESPRRDRRHVVDRRDRMGD